MTNITAADKNVFEALTSGEYCNFALVSCFVNGTPSVAIAAIDIEGDEYRIMPLYVKVTDSMVLTDHDGMETGA